MQETSPSKHLIRLVILLVGGVGAFAVFRSAMVPDSWSSEDWYRKDSLSELAQKPMKHGGNESCAGCHEDSDGIHDEVIEIMDEGVHWSLSCESCHGPLSQHVQDGRKIADANIEFTRMSCLKCHSNTITRPAGHPVFIHAKEVLAPWREEQLLKAAQEDGDDEIIRHSKKVHPHMNCLNCHESFHDPEY